MPKSAALFGRTPPTCLTPALTVSLTRSPAPDFESISWYFPHSRQIPDITWFSRHMVSLVATHRDSDINLPDLWFCDDENHGSTLPLWWQIILCQN